MVDHESGAAREQLNRVRKRCRDDWSSGGNGVNKDTRRHLVFGVVGQNNDCAGLDQCGKRLDIAIVGVEYDGRRKSVLLRLIHAGPTVRFSLRGQHLGMGLARHQIAWLHREVLQGSHGLNGSFDSFARSDEAPCQHGGAADPVGRGASQLGRQHRERWW